MTYAGILRGNLHDVLKQWSSFSCFFPALNFVLNVQSLI